MRVREVVQAPTPRRHRGAALLLALTVTAIAATLAATFVFQIELSQQRTLQVTRQSQAWQLTGGLEEWAFAVLHRDAEITPGWDDPADLWARPLPVTPFPGGQVSGQLHDLSGRLNLNDLLDRQTGADRAVSIERFRRLVVSVLVLNPAIVDQVLDYMDADNVTRARGSEAAATRRAWRPIEHLAELRALPAMTESAFERLSPHVAALAPGAPINVNTASDAVLMSLAPDMTPATVRQLRRPAGSPWTAVVLFTEHPALEGTGINPDGLDVRSSAFRAEARIVFDGQAMLYEGTLLRGGVATGIQDGSANGNAHQFEVRNRRLTGI